MNLAKLKAVIEADARKFQAVLKSVDTSTDRVFGGVRKRIAQVKADFKNELGKGLAIGLGTSLATKGLDLVGKGIQAVGDFIGTATRAASALNETVSKGKVIFGQYAADVEEWAAGAARAFGQSKRAALDAASGFAGLFATVGIELKASTDMAKNLTELGSDLASFFDTDVAQALEAIRSGLSGESEPLRRFNVFLSETAVTAKLVQMGAKKVGATFTESQKATARYQLILEQTTAAQGDFARTADGLANSQRRRDAILEDRQAALGEKFLPIALQITEWQIAFIDGLDVVGQALAGLDRNVAGLQSQIRNFLDDALDAVTFWDTYTSASDAAAASTAAVDAAVAHLGGAYTAIEGKRGAWINAASAVTAGLPKAVEVAGFAAKTILHQRIDGLIGVLRTRRGDYLDAVTAVADATWDPQINAAELALVQLALKDQELLERRRSRDKQIRLEAELEFANLQKDLARLRAAVRTDQAQGQHELDLALLQRNRAHTARNLTMLADNGVFSKAAATQLAEQFDRGRGRTFQSGVALGEKAAAGLRAGFGKVTLTAGIKVTTMATGQLGDGGRAVGGPVSPHGLYLVGEEGPEWLQMGGRGGYVHPNGEGPDVASGGSTYHVTVNNPEPRAADDDIGRMLRRLEGLGITGARRSGWSPG